MNNEFENVNKPKVTENVRTLIDQGAETVSSIKSRAGEVADNVKSGGTAARERIEAFVQASPKKAVATAFGLGYLAMRIRTSPLLKLALIGGVGYLGSQFIRR